MDEWLLLSGVDIPFPEAQLTIHQPSLKDIAYITEQRFWAACELLIFNKENLSDEDRVGLSNISNFNIIMTMVQEQNAQAQQSRIDLLSLLALVFPTYEIQLGGKTIQLRNPQFDEIKEINEDNFEVFQNILINMFCLSSKENKEYNPSGELAKKIANKIRKGHETRAKLAPETKIAIFSRYVSILSIGTQTDINIYSNYTVYQIMDAFNRFELKLHWDSWERYRIAGATGLETPDDWLKDIHNEKG